MLSTTPTLNRRRMALTTTWPGSAEPLRMNSERSMHVVHNSPKIAHDMSGLCALLANPLPASAKNNPQFRKKKPFSSTKTPKPAVRSPPPASPLPAPHPPRPVPKKPSVPKKTHSVPKKTPRPLYDDVLRYWKARSIINASKLDREMVCPGWPARSLIRWRPSRQWYPPATTTQRSR